TNPPTSPDIYLTPIDNTSDNSIMTYTSVPIGANTDNDAPFFINEAAYSNGAYAYSYACYLGPNLEWTNELGPFPTNVPVAIQQNITPLSQTNFNNYPVSFSLIVTGTVPISLEWYGNGVGIPSSAAADYNFFAFTNSYSFLASMAQNGEGFYCVASNQADTPLPTAYKAQSSTGVVSVLPNLAYPQEFLHG